MINTKTRSSKVKPLIAPVFEVEIQELQRIHRKYFHESLSKAKAKVIIQSLKTERVDKLLDEMILEVYKAVLMEDPAWLEGLSQFVEEMMEGSGPEKTLTGGE